jgi:hypothetical protein
MHRRAGRRTRQQCQATSQTSGSFGTDEALRIRRCALKINSKKCVELRVDSFRSCCGSRRCHQLQLNGRHHGETVYLAHIRWAYARDGVTRGSSVSRSCEQSCRFAEAGQLRRRAGSLSPLQSARLLAAPRTLALPAVPSLRVLRLRRLLPLLLRRPHVRVLLRRRPALGSSPLGWSSSLGRSPPLGRAPLPPRRAWSLVAAKAAT